MLERVFLEHPRSVDETYSAHLRTALGFSLLLFGSSIAVAIHALLPCLSERTASRTVARLHERMIVRRPDIRYGKCGAPPPFAEGRPL